MTGPPAFATMVVNAGEHRVGAGAQRPGRGVGPDRDVRRWRTRPPGGQDGRTTPLVRPAPEGDGEQESNRMTPMTRRTTPSPVRCRNTVPATTPASTVGTSRRNAP